MKKYLLLFIILIFPLKVFASTEAYITGSSVNMRKGTSTSYSIVHSLSRNTSITVLDQTLISGSNCSSKWLKVSYKNKTGYVCSKYVKYGSLKNDEVNVTNWTSRINSNNVNVRSGASTSNSVKNTLSLGVNVSVVDTITKKNSGCSTNKWYKIDYYKKSSGYICSKYVTNKEDTISSDEEYSKVLTEAGFPESYHPFLTTLHKKYPEWTFVASKTGLYFIDSVNKESGKCYMQTTNNSYRTSTKPSEGSTWFNVNDGVIAYYMDPRNWLTESKIFMFEKLDFDSSLEEKYPVLIKAIFNDGKLSDDKYTIPMLNAGKTNKISPIHIASRIALEVGINGSDSTNGTSFTWKGKKYSGYYNFFNIGAYETTINGVKYSAVTRGLAYAAKLIKRSGTKWNNIETAITEGSSFLANGYVNNGQGTLFYQKFNIGPNAYYSTYTHQYMTNIQAPAIEGTKTYNSYEDAKLLNQPFIFEIPVYEGMPEYTSLPIDTNTNNYLKSLSIDGHTLSPTFDEDILSYSVKVPLDTKEIVINASAQENSSTITGLGKLELKENTQSFNVVVTSESNQKRTYIITVEKIDTSVLIDEIVKTVGSVDETYLTNVKNKTKSIDLINKLKYNGAKEISIKDKNGNLLTDDAYVGTNNVITIATSKETKSFTVAVRGDTSGDGLVTILDLLQVQKHIKKSSSLKNTSFIAGDTSGDGKVTILDLLQVQKHIKGASKL